MCAKPSLLIHVVSCKLAWQAEVVRQMTAGGATGSKVQHYNNSEAIILGGAEKILGCSSKTCNKAVRGDMGLDTLSGRRDRAKLKWWHNLCTMKGDRYPRQLFDQVWEVRPRRGRQRNME